MKKILVILVAVLLLFSFISCDTAGSVAFGELEVTFGQGDSKGLDTGVSLDVDHYVLTSRGPGDLEFQSEVSASSPTVKFEKVTPGQWNLEAVAYNADDVAIGSGSATDTVMAGKKTSVEVTVREYEGQGTFNMSFTGSYSADATYTLEISTSAQSVKSITITKTESGLKTESVQLDNGFYSFTLTETMGGESRILAMDTLRMTKDGVINCTVNVNAEGEVSITIVNNIQQTPDLTIEAGKSTVTLGESLNLKAVVSLAEDYRYQWFVNYNEVEGATAATFAFTPEEEGEYLISCLISSKTEPVVWSESITVTSSDTSFDASFVYFADVSGWYHFLTVDNSGLSYIDGSDTLYHRYDSGWYEIEEVDNGCYFVFVMYPGNTYNSAFFIPKDPEGQAYLFQKYGTSNDVDHMLPCTIERFDSPIPFVEGYAEDGPDYHCVTKSWRDKVFKTTERSLHVLDASGVCSICGFDSNYSSYSIVDHADYVSEGSAKIIRLCEYWGGEFTLDDGTVVMDEDRFYLKKEEGSQDTYTLYYPSCIGVASIASGNRAGNFYAMRWYLEKYFHLNGSILEDRSSDKMEFLRIIMVPSSFVAPVADSYTPSARTTVSNSIEEVRETHFVDYHFTRYDVNDLQTEEGVPITAMDSFYYTIQDNDSGEKVATLYYPRTLEETYEKWRQFSVEGSGDGFWTYLSVYYGDTTQGSRTDADTILQLLIGSPFITPKVSDYRASRH